MKTTRGIVLACAATVFATVSLRGNPVWTGASSSDWWNAGNWKWWPEGYDAGNVPSVIPEPVFPDDAGGSSTVDLNGRRAEASGAVWVRRCDREMILWNGAVAMDSDLNLRSTEGEGAVTKGPALRPQPVRQAAGRDRGRNVGRALRPACGARGHGGEGEDRTRVDRTARRRLWSDFPGAADIPRKGRWTH